ncbi:MAG: hypothetical protein ACI4UM_07605 [Succinivibrio sp.]
MLKVSKLPVEFFNFFFFGKKAVLTNGFVKKKQKKYRKMIYAEKGDNMSIRFRDALNEQLKDPVFKKEFEAIEPEFSMIRALIAARKEIEMAKKYREDFLRRSNENE